MAKDLDLSEFGGTPELDLSEFDQPAPKPTGTLRKIGDVGIALGQGVVGGVKSITDATGASNRVSAALDSANKSLSGFLSPQRASEIAARQQTIKDAEASGSTLNEIGANLGALAEAPASTIAQGLGSIVPTVAAAYLTRGRSPATQSATTLGIGAAQGAGAVKGSIYDAVSEQHQAAGMAPEQAKAQADAAQAYTGPNAGNIAIGGAAGAAAGRFGAESIIAKMGQPARLGFIKRTGVTAAQEGATEALQGGQERLAANMALQGEGFDVPTMQGVAGQAGLEGVVGGIIGGGIGAVSGGPQPPAIETDSPDVGAVNPPGAAPGVSPSVQGGGIAAPQESAQPPAAPPPPAPSKAQAMGINPAAGPLSAGAAIAVDTGADVVTQQQAVEKQKAEAAAKEKAKPGADGKKPEPEAPPPVQPVTPDPTAPITGPFTQAIHGASNVTPPPAPAVDPQGPAATQGAGTAADTPAAPGVGADQGPQGAGPVPVAVPEPAPAKPSEQPDNGALKTGVEGVSAPAGNYKPGDKLTTNGRTFLVTGVAHTGKTITVKATDGKGFAAGEIPVSQPTQESTNATQQSRPGETIDPETGEITQSGAQGAGGDGGQRPEDALQPGADAKGPQPAPGQPAAPAAASTAPEGKPVAPTEPLDLGAHTAATSPHNDRQEPTQAQKEAGNAKLGHIVMSGLGLSIENPEGSTRRSKPDSPVKWETTMKDGHYGYVKGSIGMDGDHVDTFIKPGTPLDHAGTVFVIDQIDPATGKPDEHKVMIGYPNGMAARQAYQGNYQKGWKGFKAITPMAWDEFKAWVKSEETKKPAAAASPSPSAAQQPAPLPGPAPSAAQSPAPSAGTSQVPAPPSPVETPPVQPPAPAAETVGPVAAAPKTPEAAPAATPPAPSGQEDQGEGQIASSQASPDGTPDPAAGKAPYNDPPPAPKKPEIVVDKAEIRPYRKPDGSIGYEAIPISPPTPVVEPEPKAKPVASANTIFTEDAAAAARARLKAKLGRLNSGLDPETMLDGITLAGYHIEKGARTFAAYAKAMLEDLGDGVKPYLKSWYMGVRYDPRASGFDGMSSAAEVDAVDLEALETPQEKADTAPDQPRETLLGASNDTGRNAADDRQLLDDAVPQPGQQDVQGGDSAAINGLRTPDPQADGRPEDDRSGRGDGLDGDSQPVLPGTPAEVRPLADSPVGRTEERPDTLAGENPGNFEITFDLRLGEGTDGQKIKANLDAIRTLRLVQKEGRFPTNEEQRVMARYVGWGGLKTVFDPNKKDATDLYGKAQRELRELLNLKEYRAANGSIRNAHYTAQGIVQGMWRVARHMGFKGGRVLEPTVGIGNFIGLQPKDMAASSEWHASELDTVTGEMAALLYPEANVLASTGFQDAPFADDAFDLVIGNPPFGQQTIDDKHPNRKHLSGMKIHNYIIAKSGMHLRPGGVMSLVVTHRFLDTANPEARDVLAGDFKFLGAFRLPNNAFAANAGTEVVTDVIFLQKLRPDEPRNRDASWLDVNGKINVDGQDIRVNRYYQDNPTHILGRSATDGTMYGGRTPEEGGQGEYTVHGDGRDLGQAIDNLITGGFADMAGIMERTGSDMSAAPAMLMQSDLPVGGVMLDSDGKIRRRELDDAYGNAVVVEITRETLWKEQAAEWQALQTSLLDIRERAKDGRVTAADAQEFLALARFTFKSDGTMRSKPTKAEAAVYKLVDALARPASFTWTYDDEGLQIGLALARKQLGADGYKSLKGMLDLRNRALRLIRAEQTEDPAMEDLRKDLNTAYDAFVKANGFLSDPRNSNLLDGDIGVEAGLEASFDAAISAEVSKSTGIPARKASATKADILKQRVNFPYKEITTAATSADALSVSLSEHGKVDLPYMAKITGKSILAVINDLSTGENPQLFRDPETNEFQEAERYLSGNVRHKLEVARERNETANIKALEKVQPEPKTKSNVTPNIRGMWVPEAIFTEFLQSIGYRTPRISILASQGIMTAEGGPLAITDFGTQFRHARATAVDMFNAAVAGKPLIIYDKDSNGNRVRNDTMTKEVTALVDRMAKVFQEWAYSDDRRADAIVAAFNEKMNTHVKRTYDGVKYLRQVGASPSIKLRRTQKNAAWRMIQEQTMLADHVVGAGKTFTLITGIMERRRMGLSRKPMVAVPNHLVVQWARDFYKLYPSAKVLAATPADFARKNRRRLLARIATGDYDAIIIGHSSLGFIETPADDLRAIVDEKLAGLRETMEVARANKESKRTLGQIEDRIERYEARLEQLAERPTDEIGIDFKSMGIDHLSVDEAHEFKNLEYSTSGDRVKGMNDPNGSKKAFDLYSKVRGLLGRKGGVVFATGTPVSNSLVEIYTVMSYLAHDELVLRNQDHFDSWSGAYASTETRLEYTSTQKLKPARVLAGLNNLSALRQLYEQFADIITMADLKRIYTEEKIEENKRNGTSLSTDFPIPRVRYGARQLNSGPVTKAQQEYMDYLVARMTVIEQRRADRAYPAIDNPLNVLTDARKMSLDIRIVDPTAPRDENGKVMRAARNIKAAYDASDANRGTQLVFCDLSTPAKTASKEAKRMVTEALTLLVGEKQVKANRARFDGLSFEKQWAMLREAADRIIDDPATDEQRRDQVSEYFNAIEDAEATMLTADIGFSVYDDMRTVLMEMGIPESEIAFIHDYNTPEQKEKLFDRVNNGYIRVLMGSTMKMGAGTNAQRRVVALHHMDAPWRPSDVEQREGRVIRQGNLFATLPELIQGGVNELYDPEFEVGIDAYSTENTSDTVMWQVLERKAGAIEQFRAGGLDSTEEEGGDSNQYAEFMASSTGNPVFRLKLEAERKLTELTADISGALITRSNAASFMQQYESRRASSVAMRDAAQAASGFTSASYGGQSGTVAEFEAAMKDAEAKYLERFAEYQTRRGDAETAIAAWELLPEKTRGEKPKIPTAPSRPNLMTNTVQAGSGFARAIGLALKEARVDKQVTITLSDSAKIVIYGEEVVWKDEKNNQWYARLQMGDQKVGISFGSGLKATDSSKLVYDLTPANIAQDIERALRNASEQVADLDARKVENERRAKLDIDTSKRDAAEAELRWYERQVRFAEIESDVRRSSRPNRYIARDRRRPLGQMAKVDLAPVQTIEVDGETYTTTGVQDGSGSYMNMQATRDSDGLPAVVQIRTAQGKNNETETSVVLQPSSIPFKPKPGKSTNLRQTGAPEGNDTDVVFARGSKRATGVHMDDAEAIIAQVREALPTAPPIIPLESIAQAPADLRKFIRDAGAQDDFEAAYHNGKIYILPSNVPSATRLQFLLAHHEIRHHGFASMLGPRKNQVLFSIHATNANVRAAAAEQIRRGYATSKVLATEEALADMAVEDLVKLNGWDKIVAAVRQWLRGAVMRLRRAGLGRVADAIAPSEWTDKDVAYLIARAEGVSRGGSAKYASEGTVFGQDGDMPAFYSALTREINANTARAQPALGWASTIQGLVKAGKIKREELEWSGVLDWLRLQEGKVTRDQMVAYLDANGVRVEETVLGGGNKPPGYDADIELLSDNGLTLERNPEDPSMVAFMDENGELLSADELAEEPGLAKELVLAAYRVQEAADADKVPTRYANYQLPGGTNYREVLLTLPTGGPSQVEALSDAELRALILRNDSNAEVDDVARADLLAMVGNMDMTSTDIAKLTGKNTAQYKSGHWDQPNVLAHIRVNDRVDADGKRVLFVEEIQSDWGQQGKKEGFNDMTPALQAEYDKLVEKFRGDRTETENARVRELEAMGANSPKQRIPSAPFVTATDKWLTLALKRIITMAAQEGYDKVAFVNGDQSAERYDLSKQVKRISWIDDRIRGGRIVTIKPEGGKDIDLRVADDGTVGGINFTDGAGGDFGGKKLSDVIGKDLADKVLATKSGNLSGNGLKVGGEGMKAFYDRIVPNTLKDVLRKVGGGALETVDIGDGVTSIGMVKMSTRRPATESEAAEHIDRTGSDEGLYIESDGKVIPVDDAVNFYPDQYDEGSVGDSYINAIINRGYGSKFYIERENAPMPQPGFTITPAMRSKVAGGLPLFARGDKITEFNSDGPAKEFERYKRLVDQVGQEYTAKGSTMTFEEFTAKVKPLQDKMWEAHFKLEKWKAGRPATSTEEVFPGFQEIPIGTRILATHGLKYPEPTMGTVVGRRGLRMGEKAYVLPEVDFGDGDGRAVLPGDIKEVFAGPRTMFARGGLDSVTARTGDQTSTPAFKKWFGGSKVVNPNGSPMVVYHGTDSDFAAFNAGRGDLGKGIYFASAADDAASYASPDGRGANVMPVYVSIQNPYYWTKEDRNKSADKVNAAARRAGHDGIIRTWADSDEKHIIAFDPAQVKSAIGNNGDFDPTNSDIRFARGGLDSVTARTGDQTSTPAFKKWFGGSKVVNPNGSPMVVYHGTDANITEFKVSDRGTYGGGIYLTPDIKGANDYAIYRGDKSPTVYPLYVSIKNPATGAEAARVASWKGEENARAELIARGYDGVIDVRSGEIVAFYPEQIKSAIGNNGDFDPTNSDIRFARGGLDSVTDKINTTTKSAGNTAAHYRGLGLQALGRRQITELYGDILPQLGSYSTLMAQMDADKNEAGAQADQIAQDWGKLKDERQLAELMHDATLAQMDPEKPLMRGDDPLTYEPLRERYAALSQEAKKVYVDARDTYRTHHENVRKALRDRIERSELRGQRKAELLKQMDDEFYQSVKGVYFPLARFGDYVVIVRDPTGKTLSVNRAESINEAEALQVELRKAYPEMTVGKVLKSKEFNAGRDAVGRGFMQNLYEALGKADMDDKQRGDLEDMLGQLYLSALPDLSWAKHGIHRKGTPGFSQDARRAFAQNTFHGARYLAKVRYSDLLENELSDAQKQIDGMNESESFDSVKAQQVIDEMVKRHDAAMNPEGNALSTALTSIGFVFHLGLSPASAVVNLTQTALVAYPIMGAKWGFDKAAAALLKASQQAAANRNDISAALSPEEKLAYNEAVRSGVIDVTMAHDLAGISQGEDAKVSWKLRPVMRWASFLFHHAEKFNRQATFVAAYRLAREADTPMAQAYEQAVKATYDGHFDYSAANRPRIMQGNAAKVILLFKQYGQNMVYTLARQAYLSMKGKNQFERAQARKALGGLLTMHAAAAGVLGLPMVSTLLAAASMLGSDDDEPWDAEVALRNMLAEALGDQAADVLARGLSRLTPWDISGRVGLDKLILPDIQEGLEGQRLGESAMAAALGPVAGIGVALLKGMQEISDGNFARGLEAMAPSLLRGPARAVRYASEGAIDKTGKPIVEDVGAFGIAGQALGFSPSEVRLATEAKSAVHQADAKLAKRRATLMRHYAMAVIAGDEDGAADAREDILAFNEKNPGRRINPLQMARSVATRKKQIAESQGGVYLPKTRRDAMEAGQFGMP